MGNIIMKSKWAKIYTSYDVYYVMLNEKYFNTLIHWLLVTLNY